MSVYIETTLQMIKPAARGLVCSEFSGQKCCPILANKIQMSWWYGANPFLDWDKLYKQRDVASV